MVVAEKGLRDGVGQASWPVFFDLLRQLEDDRPGGLSYIADQDEIKLLEHRDFAPVDQL
jgi:hypothetical protein